MARVNSTLHSIVKYSVRQSSKDARFARVLQIKLPGTGVIARHVMFELIPYQTRHSACLECYH